MAPHLEHRFDEIRTLEQGQALPAFLLAHLVSTAVHWVCNYHTGGISTGQPS